MKIYHGTSAAHRDSILRHGLRPREERPSVWAEYPSIPDFVYLSTAYAPYFAINALDEDEKAPGVCMVVEVDLDILPMNRLYPDEDFVAQWIRLSGGKNTRKLQEVQKDVIANIESHQVFWKDSLDHLGNIAYKGLIPLAAITRVATFNLANQMDFAALSMDPMITTLNYRLKGQQYRSMIAWLFGDVPNLIVHDDSMLGFMKQTRLEDYDRAVAWQKEISENRRGIEVIEVNP